jgi:hypothetical protein
MMMIVQAMAMDLYLPRREYDSSTVIATSQGAESFKEDGCLSQDESACEIPTSSGGTKLPRMRVLSKRADFTIAFEGINRTSQHEAVACDHVDNMISLHRT